MYQALYRVERPETFDGVLGQEHIVRVLKNQIMAGTTSHAYLFTGTRGTGKTTLARILAKGVNCTGSGEKPCGECENCRAIKEGTFMDVIEIDAASNNGVDSVRELRESVNYPPSVGAQKVYIIDEVHMLSNAAFNALLKTLEEPPESVIFILATTDPQKLPQTILSRCMRFDFKRVPDSLIAKDMVRICGNRGIEITDGALRLLAANADGSVRDGLSLLDQCLAGSLGKIDREDVLDCLGTISDDFYIRLTEDVLQRDTAGALMALDEVLREGKDVRQLLADWLAHYRSLLISKFVKDPADLLNVSAENASKLITQGRRTDLGDINNGIKTIARTMNDAKYSTQPRTLMELAIVTLSAGLGEEPTGNPMMRSQRAIRNDRPQVATWPQQMPSQEVKTAVQTEVSAEPPAEPTAPAPTMETPAPTVEAQAPTSREPEVKSTPEVELSPEEGGFVQEEKINRPSESETGNLDGTYLDNLWEDMWNVLGDDIGSLYMARYNSGLSDLGETEFKVLAGNAVIKVLIEDEKAKISQVMSQLVGRPLKMNVKLMDEPEEEEDLLGVDPQDIAAQLAQKFNINPKNEE